MLFNRFKEVFDHEDIVAVDITLRPLGKEPYVLRFYPVYNDSYTIDFYYVTDRNEMLKQTVTSDWFLDKKEEDIQIILKDSTHSITGLYHKYMGKM